MAALQRMHVQNHFNAVSVVQKMIDITGKESGNTSGFHTVQTCSCIQMIPTFLINKDFLLDVQLTFASPNQSILQWFTDYINYTWLVDEERL